MAQTSYNGWPASPGWSVKGGQLAVLEQDGETFPPGVLRGDVYDVFDELVRDLDLIEPVDLGHSGDDWGYAYRQNRNANNLSCHASGTAIDYNAARHPNGKRNTWAPGAADKIRRLLKTKYRGLIRWGGDFTGTPDEMHFEIIGTRGQITELNRVLKNVVSAPPVANIPSPNPNPQPWLMLPAVRQRPLAFQNWYNAYPFRPALLPVIKPVANNFGPQSEEALKKVQRRYGLVADGIDGPLTKKVLWDLGYRG